MIVEVLEFIGIFVDCFFFVREFGRFRKIVCLKVKLLLVLLERKM